MHRVAWMPHFWFQTRILLLKFKLGNESRNVKKVQIHVSCIHFYSRMYMILSECTKITLEFKLLQNITLFNWNGKFHMSNIFLNVSNLSSYRRGIWILLPINTPKLLLVFTLINTQKKTSKKQNQKSRINSSPLRVKVYIWSRGLRRHWVQRGHGIGGKTSDRFNDSVCPRRRIRMLPLMISVSMVYFFTFFV